MSGVMGGIDNDNKFKLSLREIKKDIETSFKAFENNYRRYREFYYMVFKSALSDADRDNLNLIGKPAIEFPILEAYISRLRGEFSKQQPQIDVHAAEGLAIGHVDEQYIKLMQVIQAHLNEVFFQADNDEFTYDVYSDTLAGGFSVVKVYTEYVNDRSFEQKICIERVRNPTLCGFDPLASKSHKGDGRYCFELFPMSQEEFAVEFGEEKARTFNFTRAVGSFNWAYKNQDIKIVLVADFYVKVEKTATLVRLADNDLDIPTTMTLPEYNKMVKEWERIEQIPEILDKRKTTTTIIDRYTVCQNEILDRTETSYPMFPLVFIDGNSVQIQNPTGGQIEQMTRPLVYHAKGAQRLMNFAGQTIGQELEDMPRNTYMIPVQAIPKAYIKQYQNPQIAGTLAYNQFDPETGERLDAPSVVQRIPTPPLVQETFVGSQNIVQQIIGSYDATLGINDKQISGVAIQQGALQSNAAALPYLVGYIKGIQRCAEIVIHLMPLFYVTPRSIPIRLPNGKRDYQIINAPYPKEDEQDKLLERAQRMGMEPTLPGQTQQDPMAQFKQMAQEQEMEDAIMFNYDPRDLNVRIEPGVNSAIQKQVGMEQLERLMEASQSFRAFMERKGLPILIDNLDIHGAEALKEMAEEFQAVVEAERQNAANIPTDTDKVVNAEIMKSQLEAQARDQKTQADFAVNIAKVAQSQLDHELRRQELELKAQEIHGKLNSQRENDASIAAAQTIGLAIDVMKHQAEQDMLEKAQAQPAQQPNLEQ